jgi:nicotinamidase-related amidase
MKGRLTAGRFENAAFVSVDIQDGDSVHVREQDVDPEHAREGITAADVNAVSDYLRDVARPNAARLAAHFRERNIPVILVHWGFSLQGGLDLDPEVRDMLLARHGPDWKVWGHYIENPGSRPWSGLNPQPTDVILAKTAQDAFRSCTIDFVLRNLGVKNLFLVGGHTNGCLYQTGSSAVARGYGTVCIEDATWDFCMSRRLSGIQSVDYDVVCTTRDVLEFA